MTREDALATYHPIRASVRHILSSAISACNQSDFMRAAKQLGLWADGKIVLPEGDAAAEMLTDIALFEPNQRGRRAFDTFLGAKRYRSQPPTSNWPDEWATRSSPCFDFSARHEAAGVCLEDLLAGNRKLWLMDESMETSASTSDAFGMRLFDAGEFQVGFGIAVPSDVETTEFTVQGMTLNGRTPFRHSLAVTLYGDRVRAHALLAPQFEHALTLLSALIASEARLTRPQQLPRGGRREGAGRKGRNQRRSDRAEARNCGIWAAMVDMTTMALSVAGLVQL